MKRIFNIFNILLLFVLFIPLAHAQDFSYTGTVQEFTASETGYYKFEVWGAEGGANKYTTTVSPGKGGYAVGVYSLKKGQTVYVYVGGQGQSLNGKTTVYGGWNGGGGIKNGFNASGYYDEYNGSGGGATDISLVYSAVTANATTLRYERTAESYAGRLIVAGGGGGAGELYWAKRSGGAGGGLVGGGTGNNGGTQTGTATPITSGTQAKAAFGLGGSAYSKKDYCCVVGGGAGYYGGNYGEAWSKAATTYTSGGGSGYIGGVISYQDITAKTIIGSEAMPSYDGNSSMVGNSGNGHAKITFLGADNDRGLKTATVSLGTLDPTFDSFTYEYNLALTSDEYRLHIDGEGNNSTSNIVGLGDHDVPSGDSDINITVTTENGFIDVYTIHVTREASSINTLNGIKINGEAIADFEPSNNDYEVILPYDTEEVTIEPILGTPSQKLTYHDKITLSGDSAKETIFVLSEDGNFQNLYTVNIKREESTKLKSLTEFASNIPIAFNPEVTEYNVNIIQNTFEFKVNAVPYSSNAKVKIENAGFLEETPLPVIITVTNGSLTPTVYKIYIERNAQISEKVFNYPYTGTVQEFVAPYSGYYKLETWGAQGGTNPYVNLIGGKGGYSTGVYRAQKDEILYIYVGGAGRSLNKAASAYGGWNGGGGIKQNVTQSSYDNYNGTGGGATDISTVYSAVTANATTLRYERTMASYQGRIIVAGGGGGAGDLYWTKRAGGYGGGLIGGGNGGTQNGFNFQFGSGTYATAAQGLGGSGFSEAGKCCVVGGGAGYWGGAHSQAWNNVERTKLSGGGSGYLGGVTSYNDVTAYMKSGNEVMPTHDGAGTMTGNAGNGYAKITFLNFVSANNYLDNIILNNGNISLAFEPTTYEYHVNLGPEDYNVDIKAIAKDENAQVLGTGKFSIPAEENTTEAEITKEISVQASDGAIRVYKLVFHRSASNTVSVKNIKINKLSTSLCNEFDQYCNYTFNANNFSYDVLVPYSTKQIELETILENPYQTVKYYVGTIDDNVESDTNLMDLNVGENHFIVKITSEDGNEEASYYYKITRDPDGNNDVNNITVTDPVIDFTFDPNVYEYYLTLEGEADQFTVNVELSDSRATYEVIGNTGLSYGLNDCFVRVKAPNGKSTKVYIIHVYKAKDSSAFLSTLEVKDGENVLPLSPEFKKEITSYTVDVLENVDSVNLVATVNNDATITGDGIKSLKSGINTFKIDVVNGEVSTTYTIVVKRQKNSNSNLTNIEVEDYTFTPSFDNATKEYDLVIPKSVSNLVVKATPEEVGKTTVTIRGNTNIISNKQDIIITSIAEDRSYQIFKIHVTKEASDDFTLKNIVLPEGISLNETFDPETLTYTVDVDSSVDKINIEGIANHLEATVAGNGIYSLVKGDNEITLTVTSEEGQTRNYTITVRRAKDKNVNLDHIINNQNSPVTKLEDGTYVINVQSEVEEIEIMGVAESSTSTVTGNGTYSLVSGENAPITLTVTAEDTNYAQNYTVNVVRDLSINDDLDYLVVHEGALSPSFHETTIYYDVKLAHDVESIHIDSIAEDKKSHIKVMYGDKEIGANSLSNGSWNIALTDIDGLDENKNIQVIVTAENQNEKVYTLHLIPQEAPTVDLSLFNLTTNRGDFNETFSPDTYFYTLDVSNSVTDITISAEAVTEGVKIEGLGIYSLEVGKNVIAIRVKDENNIERSYQIVVTRKKSDVATLKTLVIKGIPIDFKSDTADYTVTSSLEELEFTSIVPTEKEATYKITQNNDYAENAYQVLIQVTAPDGVGTKTYTITVLKEQSKNNNLEVLTVDDYELQPVFHKATTYYTVKVGNEVNSVNIFGKAEDKNAVVTGNGTKNLLVGTNTFEIVVTSEANTTKKYTVVVIRDASHNNYLKDIILSSGTIDFDKLTKVYNITVGYDISEINIKALADDYNATVMGDGTISLKEGLNEINISVTSESNELAVYTLNITRESADSALLSSLTVKDYDFDTPFESDLKSYYIDVNNETTSLDITYTPVDGKASVEITGNKDFVVGINEVKIAVTSSSGTYQEEYIIYVNRQLSSNNYLTGIDVSTGTLSPTFQKEVISYTLTVPNEVTNLTINAYKEVESSEILSGVGSIDLAVGENVVKIQVRSSVGAVRTYTLKIIREKSKNNLLLDLIVKNNNTTFTLNETFSPTKTDYTLDVTSDMKKIYINAVKESEKASVTGDGWHDLNAGENVFHIVVTSEYGEEKEYTLTVNREVSTNNRVTMITPSVGSFDKEFNNDDKEYTLVIPAGETHLSFEVTLEDSSSGVTGHLVQGVPTSNEDRTITITSEDGNTNVFTIHLVVENATNAKLKTLKIAGYEFTFDPNTFSYNLSVSVGKKTLLENEITAEAKDSEATVNLMGDLELKSGIVNIYTIEVIAKDGVTTQEYKLNITRDNDNYSILTTDESKYEIVRSDEENYVIGILPSTNLETFKTNFQNANLLNVYNESQVIVDETFIGTKMTIKLEKDSYVYDELKIIVRGDLNYDGLVDIKDQLILSQFVANVVTFESIEKIAGDLNQDTLTDIKDQLILSQYVANVVTDINKK